MLVGYFALSASAKIGIKTFKSKEFDGNIFVFYFKSTHIRAK